MPLLSGIGKISRQQLTTLLRNTQTTISISEASELLDLSRKKAAQLLARYAAKGWLSRIKRGVYIPVPLESTTTDIPIEDPWLIAEKLYSPCYIGGWSASEHWGLTEQIFRTVVVLTTKKPHDRSPSINGTDFLLRTIPQQALFGLKVIWRGQVKVQVSNPTRTILDLLANPKLGGGIRSATDMLSNYLKSEYKNLDLLIEYAKRLNNGAVFKRLGFLLEQINPEETKTIATCKIHLSQGKVKLDTHLDCKKLITRWRLWVPENWKI